MGCSSVRHDRWVPDSTNDDDPAPLSIGLVASPSPDGEVWEAAVKRLGLAVADARTDTTTPLSVNVIFQVAGRYTYPDFEGVRTGRFNPKTKHLLVQAAIPAIIVADHDQDPDSTVRALLVLAIDEAEAWAHRKHVADNLESLRAIVRAI